MAFNVDLLVAEGEPAPLAGEFFLLKRGDITCKVHVAGQSKLKAKGVFYLSTQRIVFVSIPAHKYKFQSFVRATCRAQACGSLCCDSRVALWRLRLHLSGGADEGYRERKVQPAGVRCELPVWRGNRGALYFFSCTRVDVRHLDVGCAPLVDPELSHVCVSHVVFTFQPRLPNPAKFSLTFNSGGVGTFLRLFFTMMEKYRMRNAAQGEAGHVYTGCCAFLCVTAAGVCVCCVCVCVCVCVCMHAVVDSCPSVAATHSAPPFFAHILVRACLCFLCPKRQVRAGPTSVL